MNKVKLMIAFMFCCAIGYVGFTTYGKVTMSEAEKFMLANVEALTDGESGVGSVVICRCHDDKRCYGGNNISFRPLCSKVTAGTGGDALDCIQLMMFARNYINLLIDNSHFCLCR